MTDPLSAHGWQLLSYVVHMFMCAMNTVSLLQFHSALAHLKTKAAERQDTMFRSCSWHRSQLIKLSKSSKVIF